MASAPSLDEALSTANRLSSAANKASDTAQSIAQRVDVFNRQHPRAGRSTLSPGGSMASSMTTLRKTSQQDLKALGPQAPGASGMGGMTMYLLAAAAVVGGYLVLKKLGKI